ncbi:T6SS immunity protein Tli4 family protein [Massilia sp. SYSU DXS3249]
MKRLIQPKLAKVLAAVTMTGVVATWAGAQIHDERQARQDRQQVSRVTAKMKTVCVGRFLIYLPDEAQVELTQGRIHGLEIAAFDEPVDEFKARLARREAEIRARPDRPGGDKNLEVARDIATESGLTGKLFVHGRTVTEGTRARGLELERYRYEGIAIEALVHGHGVSIDLSADDYRPDRVGNLIKLVSQAVPNPTNKPPTEPGFCIDRAFFRDPLRAAQHERVMMSARLPSHPDIDFSLILLAGAKPEEKGLHERNAESHGRLSLAEKARIASLRTGRRSIGGLVGDEVAQRFDEENESIVYSFWWEVNGTADNVFIPHLSFKMDTGKSSRGPVPSSLSREAATALWDKISSSIRLRPAQPPKPVAAEPQPTSLGAYAWAGERCPQSGWWLREDPGPLDVTRWCAQGSLLPPVPFALPPGGFVRSGNAAKSIERRGAWHLVRLAQAAAQGSNDSEQT